MIVRNHVLEWKYLENVLNAAAGKVDEVIIVTDEENENTRNISGKFGARFIFHEWGSDFSELRNLSIAEAKSAWILVLDADELIFAEDYAGIRKAMEGEADAYVLPQLTYSNDRLDAEWQEVDNQLTRNTPFKGARIVPIPRLFRNGMGMKFIHKVHEVLEVKGKEEPLGVPIHHFKFYKGADFFRMHEARNVALMEARANEEGSAKAWMDLGLQHLRVTQDRAAAVKALEKAHELAPENEEIALNLGKAYSSSKEIGKAEQAYRKLVEKNPQSFAAAFNLATVLLRQGRREEALQLYIRARELQPGNAVVKERLRMLGEE